MMQEKALVTISYEQKMNILADISTHETTRSPNNTYLNNFDIFNKVSKKTI